MADIFMYVRQDDFESLGSYLEKATSAKAPVDVDLMDENGNTPLLVAARLGHQKSFRLLLQHGADALHVNRMGVNAMTLAAFSGNLDIIAMLLHYSSLDSYCRTTFIPPLCAATIAGHERVVQWFCDTYNNPKPERLPKTIEGVTPLMMAVIYDRPQIYMDLLQKFSNSHRLTNALNLTAPDYKQYF